jgi:nucleoside-diphosphate-sugar epimerase
MKIIFVCQTSLMGCRKCECHCITKITFDLASDKFATRIAEMQASTIVRRYENMRVASFRLPWSLPYPDHSDTEGQLVNEETAAKFLWSWVHEDDVAEAFLLGLADNDKWRGHEAFFIAAPQITLDVQTITLKNKYFPDVPVKDGKLSGRGGFFDCGKAERILGWKHR